MQILKHSSVKLFRVLQRCDSGNRLGRNGCNHMISKEMQLKHLVSNDATLCWTGNDVIFGVVTFQQCAARFNSQAVARDFRTVFEKCQDELKEVPDSPDDVISKPRRMTFLFDDFSDADDGDDDDDDDDDNDGDENWKRCTVMFVFVTMCVMSKQTELTVLGNTREGHSDQKHQHMNRTLTNRGIFVQYAS